MRKSAHLVTAERASVCRLLSCLKSIFIRARPKQDRRRRRSSKRPACVCCFAIYVSGLGKYVFDSLSPPFAAGLNMASRMTCPSKAGAGVHTFCNDATTALPQRPVAGEQRLRQGIRGLIPFIIVVRLQATQDVFHALARVDQLLPHLQGCSPHMVSNAAGRWHATHLQGYPFSNSTVKAAGEVMMKERRSRLQGQSYKAWHLGAWGGAEHRWKSCGTWPPGTSRKRCHHHSGKTS